MNPIPLLTTIAAGSVSSAAYEMSDQQLASLRLLQGFTVAWVFGLGAVIGSFLNVVVYRLPRGMSLSHPKSRCCSCHTPIGRQDNLPIIGWLLLRGRCRACAAPISPRYPLVELAVATVFLGLLLGELLRGGANLPLRIPNLTHGNAILWIIWYTKWNIVGIAVYHTILLISLLSIGLLAGDGYAPPRRLLWLAMCSGALLPIVWPELHPVPAVIPQPGWMSGWRWEVAWTDRLFSPGWTLHLGVGLEGLVNVVAGGLIGGGVGWFASRAQVEASRRAGLRWGFVLVGMHLGWQACLSVAALLAVPTLIDVLLVLAGWGRASRLTSPLFLWIAAFLQILAWKALDSLPCWLSHQGISGLPWTGVVNWAISILVVASVVAVTSRLSRNMHAKS
ncbi:MAG: prepilin peptidase [Planctomycetaceae bacterium]